MTPRSIGLLKNTDQIHGISPIYFAAYHRATRGGHQDVIAQFIRDFRDGIEPQTSRWISLVVPLICSSGSFDVVVRALGSGELAARGNWPLDRLCGAIALQSGATYAPELLVKTRTTRTLTNRRLVFSVFWASGNAPSSYSLSRLGSRRYVGRWSQKGGMQGYASPGARYRADPGSDFPSKLFEVFPVQGGKTLAKMLAGCERTYTPK